MSSPGYQTAKKALSADKCSIKLTQTMTGANDLYTHNIMGAVSTNGTAGTLKRGNTVVIEYGYNVY